MKVYKRLCSMGRGDRGEAFLFSLFLLFFAVPGTAQTFTEQLTQSREGEGQVTLQQDSEITALVNGTAPVRSASAARTVVPDTTLTAHTDTTSTAVSTGRRMKTVGYRIQVYAGGNNRQSKAEALYMANLVRSTFSGIPVYTHFVSPRWICRVGDFRTYEEANELLRRMRITQQFREASIVKSRIIVNY